MDRLVYILAKILVGTLQALPLTVVARLGRFAGATFYCVDASHRRVAIKNLTASFPERSASNVRALARENFRRIGENLLGAIKTASMSAEALRPHLEFVVPDEVTSRASKDPVQSFVTAIGHFGNFELYARFGHYLPAYQCATTYRSVRPPSLNRLLQSLREQSGCLFFERRHQGAAVRALLKQPGTLLGLLCDQSMGHRGVHIPFLGRTASTDAAPAVLALRYKCPLYTAVCYRTALARWRVEAGPQIPTQKAGRARTPESIMRDVNAAFEQAVRRDPANWFWVHNRWKGQKASP